MRTLQVTAQFKKDIRGIPLALRVRIDGAALKLQSDPLSSLYKPKKLKGIKPSVWRVRIGSYRLLYTFDAKLITLLKFAHRKDVYRNL